MARLCPLFSGSSGNSFYIGTKDAGILIDAGRSAKQIEKMLALCEISVSAVKAIFITHEHSDHVSGLRVFASRYRLPVFASVGTLQALCDMGVIDGTFPCGEISAACIACADMQIQAFRIPHDCAQGLGYRVQTADGRKVVFSTDLGFVPDSVRENLFGNDVVVIESNHDVDMLRTGPYPYPLKRRILSQTGHLSNDACAQELPVLAKGGATRFMLAHLSKENNLPEKAYHAAMQALTDAGLSHGLDFELFVAPRENVSGQMILF